MALVYFSTVTAEAVSLNNTHASSYSSEGQKCEIYSLNSEGQKGEIESNDHSVFLPFPASRNYLFLNYFCRL